MNESIQHDPLSASEIESLAQAHGLDLDTVANAELLWDYLQDEVEFGDMLPADALELYSLRLNMGNGTLVELAEEFLNFTEYDGACQCLNDAYEHGDISELLDHLKERPR